MLLHVLQSSGIPSERERGPAFPGGRNRRYVGRFPANGRVGLQCVSVPSDQLTKIEELLHSSNVDVAAVIEGLA